PTISSARCAWFRWAGKTGTSVGPSLAPSTSGSCRACSSRAACTTSTRTITSSMFCSVSACIPPRALPNSRRGCGSSTSPPAGSAQLCTRFLRKPHAAELPLTPVLRFEANTTRKMTSRRADRAPVSLKVARLARKRTRHAGLILRPGGHHVHDRVHALQLAGYDHEVGLQDALPVQLEDRRPEDDVVDAGLVLQRGEDHAVGGLRMLQVSDQ